MNRGLASLEKFEYLLAMREFSEALEIAPDWTEAKVNLAIALLNMQGPANLERVQVLCGEILAKDPRNPYANFLAGVVRQIGAEAEAALPFLDVVIDVDPRDPGASHWRGRCLIDLGRIEEAEAAFARAIELDPYLGASYYARSGLLRFLRRGKEADEVLAESLRLMDGPDGKPFPYPGDLITAKAYHEIGRYAMAIRDYDPAATLRFTRPEPGPLALYRHGGNATALGPGIAVGDIDGDGDADLFLPEWNGPGSST